jgi:ATP-binding cassette subfamily A (ABC1) protein 3
MPLSPRTDEPTTGVDPASRRQLWDFIAATSRTRAMILTTHSMEECEALCARVGILIDGALRCVGSVQHLKDRFADGFQLSMQLAADDDNASSGSSGGSGGSKDVASASGVGASSAETDRRRAAVVGAVRRAIAGATLSEHAGQTVKFHVPRCAPSVSASASGYASASAAGLLSSSQQQQLAGAEHSLPRLFASLETLRAPLRVQQYALGQETLENIFLRFVREAEAASAGSEGATGAGFSAGGNSGHGGATEMVALSSNNALFSKSVQPLR